MKITSILTLATALVALSISAHAEVVFSFATVDDVYPTTKSSANFNDLSAVDADGNPYNIYGNTDTGTGAGWGGAVITNFDGSNFVANAGEQNSGTTYLGPSFYAGINRDVTQFQAGVIHGHGNGFRIRCNNVSAELIDGDGNGPTAKAVFMFDADTSSLSGGDDNLIFADSDTFTAKLAVPVVMGTNDGNRASAASYRAMVKANGEYYAGTLYTVDLSLVGGSTSVLNMSESCADATWTLMPSMDGSDYDAISSNPGHPQNLTVDTSSSATTVPGIALTNITQVGFYLESTANEQTGGYNYGVREFIAQATPASTPDPIEWSQDFTSVSILDDLSGLSGDGHAYTWSKSGAGATADPSVVAVDSVNNQAVISITQNGNNGEAKLHMVGPGTTNARRVKPPSHETTWEIDLLAFKNGNADLMLSTRGFDGWIKSTISPSGVIKYTTWMADLPHTNFDDYSAPTRLRVNANNVNSGVKIETGGTFDGSGGVTVSISAPEDSNGDPIVGGVQATGTVFMNVDNTAVERVAIDNAGSGYIADPTVTFAGGGMTVAPTVSFNYSTGNVNGGPGGTAGNPTNTHVAQADIALRDDGTKNWSLLADGQVFTYIQSYNNADDSVSYYYSLDGAEPTFITTLNVADHSPAGQGFFNFITGNPWGSGPSNQDAVTVHYKRYGAASAAVSTVGINSMSVAVTDDDRDGVNNRVDEFPNDPLEDTDSDSDGVGDNSDAYAGYDDTVMSTLSAAQTSAADTFNYYVNENWVNATNLDTWLTSNNYIVDDGSTGGLTEQDLIDLRVGSTLIDASSGSATITIQMEESSDLTTWSDMGVAGQATVTVPMTGDASFFRVRTNQSFLN